VSIVLEDQLLQVEEGALVINTLSYLHYSFPGVVSEGGLAVHALLVPHDELYDEGLLQDGTVLHLLLHSELQLQPAAVRFSPDPGSVDELDLLEAIHFAQADGHELSALQRCLYPARSQPPHAASALQHS
jgi:hypothetical protein